MTIKYTNIGQKSVHTYTKYTLFTYINTLVTQLLMTNTRQVGL